MNDTPIEGTSQIEEFPKDKQTEFKSLLVSFAYTGTDNGMEKQGFDSRCLKIPVDVQIATAEDVKAIADAIANSEFNAERRFAGLEITILNLAKLPL